MKYFIKEEDLSKLVYRMLQAKVNGANKDKQLDLQEEYIDEFHYKYGKYGQDPDKKVKIPDNILLAETIAYALNKDLLFFLGRFNVTKENDELIRRLSQEAIKKAYKDSDYYSHYTKKVFANIPDQVFDEDFSIYLLKFNAGMIRYIPSRIITLEFLNKLDENSINYQNNIQVLYDKMTINNDDYVEEGKIIPVDDLDEYFAPTTIKLFKDNGINSIGKLFNFYDKGYVAILVHNSQKQREILNTIKLLKTKYLDIDPQIEEDTTLPLVEVLTNMGISNRTIARLNKNTDYTMSEIFEILRKGQSRVSPLHEEYADLNHVSELVSKASIVMDYHDKHPMNVNCDDKREKLVKIKEMISELSNEYKNRLDLINNEYISELEKLNTKYDNYYSDVAYSYNRKQEVLRSQYNTIAKVIDVEPCDFTKPYVPTKINK